MHNPHENKKLLEKLERCITVFDPYIFEPLASPEFEMYETDAHLRAVPAAEVFGPATPRWGHAGGSCWFRFAYRPAAALAGVPLYVMPQVGGYEALLWVDGAPQGTFATKIVVTRHGNHYCDLLCAAADPAHSYEVALEFYAGHPVEGCQPFEVTPTAHSDFSFAATKLLVCTKNQLVADFLYDLRILLQLAQMLDEGSFRRAQVLNTLEQVHLVLRYAPEECPRAQWLESLRAARAAMAPCLACKNGSSAPQAVLTGHSHMDTAWLWPVRETVRKNARTIANQLSLMRQFPEYRFIQSSSLHSHMLETEYPALFEQVRAQVQAGRYEINGAVWVECDCNLVGGEALIRQFLWGQRYTQKTFGVRSDCFWLPDTFGYSAAIPQIMRGFGVRYFLTTKLAWNDTNTFPWETFMWEGLDRSQVLAHFFVMDTWPDPKGLLERLNGVGYADCLHNKQVSQKRLVAFGFGDGGGGPQFEMIELARRMADVEGCPKVRYASASAFMQELAADATHTALPTYKGELYLELHRGTLTAKQQIKKNNRLCEIALHNLDLLTVLSAVRAEIEPSDAAYRALWGTLLQNQFHDILPGSCIPAAHDDSLRETGALLQEAATQIARHTHTSKRGPLCEQAAKIALFNPLSFARTDVQYLPLAQGCTAVPVPGSGLQTQRVTLRDGTAVLAVAGAALAPLCTTPLAVTLQSTPSDAAHAAVSAFTATEHTLETPFYSVAFAPNGAIAALTDKRTGRALCGPQGMNCFYSAEDVPAAWDGWDIDADCLTKLAPDGALQSRCVAANGAVEYRIRSSYRVCSASVVRQDMIFYADSSLIVFDTELVWNDPHQLLQVAFDTTVQAPFARHEIQFGHIQRPTTRNNPYQQAMFEVCNHKYSDLSEPGYGIALFNDCKYGCSALGGRLTLSLAKGGMRPDPRGDCGTYTFRYALAPHTGGFYAASVVQPAYCFNLPALPMDFDAPASAQTPLVLVDAPNMVVETVKPCEDAQHAFIVRLYECEGTAVRTQLHLGVPGATASLCNMLEEPTEPLLDALVLEPFQIQTIQVQF